MDARSILRTLGPRTTRDIGLLLIADALVGLSLGAIAVGGGLEPWVPIVMSVLVFAGGSQFAAVGILIAGGDPVAAVIAGLVLNSRHLAFGFAVASALGARMPLRLLGAHLITDESTAFAIAEPDPARKRVVYWSVAVALFVAWNVSVAIGALLGTVVGDTDALGIDAAFPAVLLALVLPSVRRRPLIVAVLVGAVIAVATTPFLPAGMPVLMSLIGLVFVLPSRLRGETSLARPTVLD